MPRCSRCEQVLHKGEKHRCPVRHGSPPSETAADKAAAAQAIVASAAQRVADADAVAGRHRREDKYAESRRPLDLSMRHLRATRESELARELAEAGNLLLHKMRLATAATRERLPALLHKLFALDDRAALLRTPIHATNPVSQSELHGCLAEIAAIENNISSIKASLLVEEASYTAALDAVTAKASAQAAALEVSLDAIRQAGVRRLPGL